MKDYLQLWLDQRRSSNDATIPSPIELVGEFDKHLGPTWPKAAARIAVEPAEVFEVVDEVEPVEGLDYIRHPDWFVFGILDVLLTDARRSPLRVRITIKETKIHPVESTPWAFRLAGRDAGRKILNVLYPPAPQNGTTA